MKPLLPVACPCGSDELTIGMFMDEWWWCCWKCKRSERGRFEYPAEEAAEMFGEKPAD